MTTSIGYKRPNSYSCTTTPVDNNNPLVSIITVTKNSSSYLEQSISSVIKQTYQNIEYIIYDGMSEDGTIDILKRHDADIDYWISEPDTSMYNAINKAIKMSNGDIIAILNSDDLYYDRDTISTIVEFIQKNDVDGAYGDLIIDYGYRKKYRKVFQLDYEKYLLSGKGTLIPHITFFIKRSCLHAIGQYDESYKYASDYDFILRCLKKCRIKYIARPIAIFRRHDKSITSSGKIRSERELILRHYGYTKYPLYKSLCLRAWIWLKFNLLNASKNITLPF